MKSCEIKTKKCHLSLWWQTVYSNMCPKPQRNGSIYSISAISLAVIIAFRLTGCLSFETDLIVLFVPCYHQHHLPGIQWNGHFCNPFHIDCMHSTFLLLLLFVLYGFVFPQRYLALKASVSSILKVLPVRSLSPNFTSVCMIFCRSCSWGHYCRFSESVIKPQNNTP